MEKKEWPSDTPLHDLSDVCEKVALGLVTLYSLPLLIGVAMVEGIMDVWEREEKLLRKKKGA